MSGRYTSIRPIEVYAELFNAKAGNLFVEPRYNIASTHDVLACQAIPAGPVMVTAGDSAVFRARS
ncbi:MAG: hypothetical protein Tsb0026_00080 [Sulfuricaulis sp.]